MRLLFLMLMLTSCYSKPDWCREPVNMYDSKCQ